MIELISPKGALGLTPQAGGSVSYFRWNDVDILRPFDPALGENASATAHAAFPMFPFSGRIALGRFTFDGNSHQIPPNFSPEPHAIHGTGWQVPWEVCGQDANSVQLCFTDTSPNWPWVYHAEQSFTLRDNGLHLSLQLTNLSDTDMPAGMGWHPYFPAKGAMLQADVSAVWLSGDDMIPGSPSPLSSQNDLTYPRSVAQLNLDNGFAIGGVGARISWQDDAPRIHISASDTLRHLVVYTPPADTYFCVEPVSHCPNAVNSREPATVTGLRALKPGETLSGEIMLEVLD